MPPTDYMHAPVRALPEHRTSTNRNHSLVAKMVVESNPAKEAMVCLPVLLEELLGDELALWRRPGEV